MIIKSLNNILVTHFKEKDLVYEVSLEGEYLVRALRFGRIPLSLWLPGALGVNLPRGRGRETTFVTGAQRLFEWPQMVIFAFFRSFLSVWLYFFIGRFEHSEFQIVLDFGCCGLLLGYFMKKFAGGQMGMTNQAGSPRVGLAATSRLGATRNQA